jgi:sec-independent protein translocase protein TatC
MFNWAFKKIVKFREKVAVDLGDGDVEKPFLDHLDDLRTMLVRMCITLIVVTVGAFYFYQELLALIERPLVMAGIRDKVSLQNLKPIGGFMTAMNVSLVAGVVTAFPLLLYFLLQFVLPGLRSNEKKVVFPALAVGAGLFLIGVLFAFYVVSPRALQFFYEFSVEMDQLSAAEGGAKPPDKLIWERVEYVKFVCQFVLIFGACFELPVVVMAFVKLDVLNYKVMKGSRAWAAIIIAVVAAVITPTQDALTLGLLAVPMYALYEICIWLAWWMEKKDRQLYPEYYKEQDADAKEVAVADDWDNETYNPFSQEDDEEEDVSTGAATASKPVSTSGDAPASADPGSSSEPVAGQDPSQESESPPAAKDSGDSTPAADGPDVEKRDTD